MMKKLLPVLSIVVLVWGCAKKMTPAKSETPTTNTSTVAANNATTPITTASTTNTGATAAPTTPTDTKAKVVAKPGSGNDAAAIAGQATFNAKCGRCHGLKVTTNYTWERWVSIMQVMAMKANLDATEKENVLVYVKANAKP